MRDGAVGRDKAEHRSHIDVNHTAAFTHGADRHRFSAERKLYGAFFILRVGRHNRFARLFVIFFRKTVFQLIDFRFDFFDGKLPADNAGRTHDHVAHLDAERICGG